MRKPFTTMVALFLLFVSVAQAVRAIVRIEIVVAGHQIPMIASWIAAVVAFLFSVMLFRESRG